MDDIKYILPDGHVVKDECGNTFVVMKNRTIPVSHVQIRLVKHGVGVEIFDESGQWRSLEKEDITPATVAAIQSLRGEDLLLWHRELFDREKALAVLETRIRSLLKNKSERVARAIFLASNVPLALVLVYALVHSLWPSLSHVVLGVFP